MPPRKLPPDDQLMVWLQSGYTHKQIVKLVKQLTGNDVSESTVSVAVSRLGKGGERRKNHLAYIPWRVQAIHARQYPVLMLRAYARYMDAGEDPSALTHDDWRRLRKWLAQREETKTVVDYRPDEDGFVYVPRRRGESVIREPKKNDPLRRTG